MKILEINLKSGVIDKRGWSNIEDRHGMAGAIFAYPMIENAIRGHENRTIRRSLSCNG